MHKAVYFYRHPLPAYFSIEKLFKQIAGKIKSVHFHEIDVEEAYLPYVSKPKSIIYNILFARKHQADINHITGDIHYAIIGCNRKHVNVLTVHDCVLLHRYLPKSPRHWIIKLLWYDLPVKKADVITVISENTREELIHFTKCDPEKIRVISNFIDPDFQYAPFFFQPQCPRILFIGTTPNKNLDRLTEALEGVPAVLDIIGQLSAEQISKLKKHGIHYEQSEGLSKEALMAKYRHCDLVAFPSTYEGFGLPIIEAQATGRPLLTSNLSPMREVAGEGACVVDCYDVNSIKKGLHQIIKDDVYRENLIQKGLDNVKRFSLDKIAEQYAALYKEFLQKKKISKT